MKEHTPGPWRTEERLGHARGPRDVIVGRDGERVAVIGRSGVGSLEGAKANASLITAAPHLLRACEAALLAIGTLERDALGRDERHGYYYRDELASTLRAAIAKAKGE
jgi:hypothetical protein